jgi:hypothetical protein
MITQSPTKKPAIATSPTCPTTDTKAAAINAAANDRNRCQAILSLDVAAGRERLAAHCAYETAVSVTEARAILAAATPEPGSPPAIAAERAALAQSIINAGRVRR